MITRPTAVLSAILLIVFVGMVSWWHQADTRPSSFDETKHMQLALDYRDWMARGVPLTNEWAHVYPPAYHLSILPALSAGVPTEYKVSLTHALYLLILIAGCILLEKAQNRPDWGGAVAALLATGYCYSLWAGRRALIDFDLMAWVTLSIALLARTKGFSQRRASLLWGLSAGIGLLFKPTFIFFLAGPLVWAYACGRSAVKTKNLLGALGLLVLAGAPWYWWNGIYFLDKVSGLVREQTAVGVDPRTLAGWLYYFRILPEQLGLGSLLFTVLGIACLVVRRKRAPGSGMLALWALSGYLILSVITNKDPRHSLPIFPALALLSVRGWEAVLPPRWAKGGLAAMGLLLMMLNILTYDRPVREDWKHYEIGRTLAAGHDASLPFLSAATMAMHVRFFSRGIKWSLRQEGVAMKPVSPGDADAGFAEYLITRQGSPDQDTQLTQEEWNKLKPGTRAFKVLYSPDGRFPLPDGSESTIYQRNPHPRFQVEPLTAKAIAAHLAKVLRRWVDGPLTVDVEGSPAELAEGRPQTVRIACAPARIKGITAPRVELTLHRPWFNLYRLWDENRLGLLGFDSIEPTLDLSAGELEKRLAAVRGVEAPTVHCSRGRVWVSAKIRGIPVQARARVEQTGGDYPTLTAVLEQIRLAHIPLPGWVIGKAYRQNLPLYPIPSFPGRILIHRVTAENDHLIIS